MSDIERTDDPLIDEPEATPEPTPEPPKDGRKKPRSEKQEAAFKRMTEKRKELIAKKKEAKDPRSQTPAPPVPQPRSEVVNNYYYYNEPVQAAPVLKRTPVAREDSSDDEPDFVQNETTARQIYFA